MNTADRLRAAYKTVDDAAPSLVLGNDPVSGVRIIAHAAINIMRHLSPSGTKAFLEGWTKTVADDLDRADVR